MTKLVPPVFVQDADLVDRIFDYILSAPELTQKLQALGYLKDDDIGKLKDAVREEFAGENCYISHKPPSKRQEMVQSVLSQFNGRNATTIARELGVSRSFVYRAIKQSGK